MPIPSIKVAAEELLAAAVTDLEEGTTTTYAGGTPVDKWITASDMIGILEPWVLDHFFHRIEE